MEERAVEHVEYQSEPESLPAASGLTLPQVRLLVSKYRRGVVGSTVLAGVLAAVVSFFIPNQYTATTTILPPPQNTSIGGVLSSAVGNMGGLAALAGGGLGLKDPNDAYIGMLQSRVIEDKLIHQFNLTEIYHVKKMSLAQRALAKHSTILSTKDGFISIAVEDRDPTRAADMAKAYVTQLENLRSTIVVTEAGQRRMFFEQQLQDAQAKLVLAEQQLKDTQQQTGVLQLDAQMKAVIESMTQLKAQIAEKEVALQVLGSYVTKENPQRVVAEREVAGLQGQLALLENKQGGGKGDIQVPTSEIPAIEMTYLKKVRDVRYYETISEILAKQLEVARLDEAKEGTALQVLDPAVPPDTKSFPSRTLIVALAAFLGFLISMAFIVTREVFADVHQRYNSVAP
jgi:tyrosine-protein kinase Etk/Wzc